METIFRQNRVIKLIPGEFEIFAFRDCNTGEQIEVKDYNWTLAETQTIFEDWAPGRIIERIYNNK